VSIKESEDAIAVISPDRAFVADAPESPNAPASGRGRTNSAARAVLPPLVFGALLLSVWYFISYQILTPERRFLLRPPHAVVNEAYLDPSTLADMMNGLWVSTKVAAYGLSISILLGFFLAIIMSQAKMFERAMFPYLVILQAIPILAIVPLIQFWFGTGQTARIIVCVIISLFPIIVNTLFGLQSAERGMHDLFTLHHANRAVRLRKLMFPGALPAVFAGLRISAGLSVIGAIVGDFLFGKGEPGIGKLIQRYANRLQGEELLGAVLLSSFLGVTVFLLFGWIQNRVIGKWYEGGSSRGT